MSMESAFKDLAGGLLTTSRPSPCLSRRIPHLHASRPPVQIERLAETQGFVLDNLPLQRKVLKSGRVASRDKPQPMSLRIRVGDWNKFSAFCERNEYSVAEGFAKLAELVDSL